MYNRYVNLFRFFFAFMDLFALNSVHLVLTFMMSRVSSFGFKYILLFLITNMIWLASAYINAVYVNDNHFNFEHFAKRSLKAFVLFSAAVLLFIFLSHLNYSRMFVILNFVGFGLTILSTRVLFLLMAFYMKKLNRFNKKIIFLGYNDLSKRLVNHFLVHNQNLSIDGYFENPREVNELTIFPILGGRNECLPYAIEHKITEIYSTFSPEKYSDIYEFKS